MSGIAGIYQLYGLSVVSEVPIPELVTAGVSEGSTGAQTRLRFALPRNQEASAVWFMEWTLPSGALWLSCGKTPDGYLLRFPTLADFSITADGQDILSLPTPGTPQETLHHLLLDQVLPLTLSIRGREALHAAAILTPRGVCAFFGPSGIGKSTLASSFLLAGYPLVSDDCLVVEEVQGKMLVTAAYPGVRLWDDALVTLFLTDTSAPPVAHYTTKRRPWVERNRCATGLFPLVGIYLLTRNADDADDQPSVRIETLSAQAGFRELLTGLFRLDITDPQMLKRQFCFLERLVSLVPVRRLLVPTSFSALPTVREAILNDLEVCT
jgi:hypothetical protein